MLNVLRIAGIILTAAFASQAAVSAKSMSEEYVAMIGNWRCHVTEAGKPDSTVTAHYEWADGGTVLHETMQGEMSGEFFTTYDKRSGSFKGVGVGSWGGYVVWENPGAVGGKSSEVGYVFGAGKMTPVSRSDFEILSPTHYIVHDFMADSDDGKKGAAADTEDCSKQG